MRSKYLLGVAYLNATCLPYHYPIWKRIYVVREKAKQYIFWSIGNGNILFWHDNRLSCGHLTNFCPEEVLQMLLVYSFWWDGMWD